MLPGIDLVACKLGSADPTNGLHQQQTTLVVSLFFVFALLVWISSFMADEVVAWSEKWLVTPSKRLEANQAHEV